MVSKEVLQRSIALPVEGARHLAQNWLKMTSHEKFTLGCSTLLPLLAPGDVITTQIGFSAGFQESNLLAKQAMDNIGVYPIYVAKMAYFTGLSVLTTKVFYHESQSNVKDWVGRTCLGAMSVFHSTVLGSNIITLLSGPS